MTKQRKLILDIINASSDHLTAEGVFSIARQHLPSIAIGTVYRNLGILADSGAIRRVPVCGADRYDKAGVPHDHAECVCCGRLFDIPKNPAPASPQLPKGARYLDCEMVFRCLCGECSESR